MKTFAKAIVAGISAGIAALAAQLEAVESFGDISDLGWVLFVGAIFGAGAAVFYTPNKPA